MFGRIIFVLGFISLVCATTACSRFVQQPSPAASLTLVSERRLTDDSWDRFQWSPNGSQLLLSRQGAPTTQGSYTYPTDGEVAVVDIRSNYLRALPITGFAALWSPDGSHILVLSRSEKDAGESVWWIYNPKNGSLAQLAPITNSYPFSWMEDGVMYQDAAGMQRIQIVGLPLDSASSNTLSYSKPELVLTYDGSQTSRWAFPSPDGQTYLLYEAGNDASQPGQRRWWLAQPDGSRIKMPYPLYSLGICCRWSPDGSQLAFFSSAAGEQHFYIADNRGQNVRQLVSGDELGEGSFLSLDFSPDGSLIAFVWTAAGEGFPFEMNEIYVVGADSGDLKQLTMDHSHPHNWLSWSPDGRRFAFRGANGEIWLAEVGFDGPLPANLTPAGDLASWTEADFIAAVRTGQVPSGTFLTDGMPRYDMTDEDLAAIFKYLKTVPAAVPET